MVENIKSENYFCVHCKIKLDVNSVIHNSCSVSVFLINHMSVSVVKHATEFFFFKSVLD